MSPRRSSRARATNPPLGATTNSSTSSLSSGRERNTRSQQKPIASPHPSDPRSESRDAMDDKLPPRRTRSGHDEVPPPEPDEEEEEVTRCVCGQLEYPGLPTPIVDEEKQRAKQGGAATPEEIADDSSGIFIQCDICKVWQHGGCVGILDDDSAPEEYFCEQCRKDLHNVSTTPSGQKFSRYKPVRDEPSPAQSPPPSAREGRKGREGKPRASTEAVMAKRRPTMNSYDEQEQLRRAIEESKKDGLLVDETKHGKRSREESEEPSSPSKRQRTGSHSSFAEHANEKSALSSSDEALIDMKPTDNKTRNTRTRETQRERERHTTVVQRKTRVERRRGDESDPTASPPVPSAAAPSTKSSPPAPHSPQQPTRSHKKPLPPSKVTKARRAGRVQAIRDALPPSSLQHALDPNAGSSPMNTRSRSRSRAPESPPDTNGTTNGATSNGALHPPESRPSRPKHMNPNRTSLNEMKKRVAGILEFVAKAQEEVTRQSRTRTGTSTSSNGAATPASNGGSTPRKSTTGAATPSKKPSPAESAATPKPKGTADRTVNGADVDGAGSPGSLAEPDLEPEPLLHGADFAGLSAADMIRVLKSRLKGWEGEFGRWGKAA